MGQMFMYDAFQNIKERNSEFTHFTIDDVDTTFDRFTKLKYSQDIKLPGFCSLFLPGSLSLFLTQMRVL